MINYLETKIGSIVLGAICIAIPLLVGLTSAKISGDQMSNFGLLNQPPLSPPAWLFPVAWTILYVLMGIALLLIFKSESNLSGLAIALFMFQLALNFLWSPVFFVSGRYVAALIILLLMLIMTIALASLALVIDKRASYLLVPYILWMCFATYLNVGVGILNS